MFSRLIVVLGLLATIATARAEVITGRVVGVLDGDTIDLLTPQFKQQRIRLAFIDAPEKAQAFGTRSKAYLSSLVFARSVEVDVVDQDTRHNRVVGRIRLHDKDINLEMVKAGLAWHYKQYTKKQSAADRQAYSHAELSAQTIRAGLWSDANPVAPSNFRHGKTAVDLASAGNICPCSETARCIGPKGGVYCLSAAGEKVYQRK